MIEPIFTLLTSARIAEEIRTAERSVCYAAPGIHPEPAAALVEFAGKFGPELITVCLDFNEHAMRMGFGTLDAVKILREAGILVTSTSGLRTGFVVIDRKGYIFTPTAFYLETEERSDMAPNAMRLAKDQTTEILARLSPAAKAIAIASAETEEKREQIRKQAIEVSSTRVEDSEVKIIEKRFHEAPPVNFDVARQLRVFKAYLQYVELKLSGAAVQRRRVSIPKGIQNLGVSKEGEEYREELEKRLKTTFDLIEGDQEFSSKELDDKLRRIREDFTRSLGKHHGRVVLKKAKPKLDERLEDFRKELNKHQKHVREKLQSHLDKSRDQIVKYYFPLVVENPPDAALGQYPRVGEAEAKSWLTNELNKAFPEVEKLCNKMELTVIYKEMTFETLNQEDFLEKVKRAFPALDWDKAYEESRAVGEKADHPR